MPLYIEDIHSVFGFVSRSQPMQGYKFKRMSRSVRHFSEPKPDSVIVVGASVTFCPKKDRDDQIKIINSRSSPTTRQRQRACQDRVLSTALGNTTIPDTSHSSCTSITNFTKSQLKSQLHDNYF